MGFVHRNRWWLPSWQFAAGATLPGLELVIKARPGGRLALATWALEPAVDLAGQTPAEALARRRLMRVLKLERSIEAATW